MSNRVADPANDEQAGAVFGVGDGAGDAVGESDDARPRLLVVDVDEMDGGAEPQVAVLAHRAGERERRAVR